MPLIRSKGEVEAFRERLVLLERVVFASPSFLPPSCPVSSSAPSLRCLAPLVLFPSSSPGFPSLRSSYLLNLQILDHLFNLVFLLLSHLLLKLLSFLLVGHPSVVVFARVIALLVSYLNCHPFLVSLLVASHRVRLSWIFLSLVY